MSDLETSFGPDRVELRLDEASFPREAVYAAAYTFIDRCWVRLDRPSAGRLAVILRSKSAGSLDGEALVAELRSELLGGAFRQRLADEGRALVDAVVRGAFGGSDSPPIDDLLAGHDGGDPQTPGGAPFEDPLGIALSWEAGQAGGDPQTPGPAGQKTEGEQGA